MVDLGPHGPQTVCPPEVADMFTSAACAIGLPWQFSKPIHSLGQRTCTACTRSVPCRRPSTNWTMCDSSNAPRARLYFLSRGRYATNAGYPEWHAMRQHTPRHKQSLSNCKHNLAHMTGAQQLTAQKPNHTRQPLHTKEPSAFQSKSIDMVNEGAQCQLARLKVPRTVQRQHAGRAANEHSAISRHHAHTKAAHAKVGLESRLCTASRPHVRVSWPVLELVSQRPQGRQVPVPAHAHACVPFQSHRQ
jgi:hypothetical protein